MPAKVRIPAPLRKLTKEQPVVEIAGVPEQLEGGGVRLPISISIGGKTKRLTLTISLTPDLN